MKLKLPEAFFFHRLLKLKEAHARRHEKEEDDPHIEGLADATSKLSDSLWDHGPTATEFVLDTAYDSASKHGEKEPDLAE